MAELMKIRFIDFKAARIVGKPINHQVGKKDNPLPAFWDQCLKDGTFTTLESSEDRLTFKDRVGWMGEYDPATGKFLYIVGMMMQAETPVPEGYVFRDLPDCTMAVTWIKGSEANGDIYINGMNLSLDALAEHGYSYDTAANYSIEVYSYERFVVPMERGENEVVLDYYVPCQKVETCS